LAGLSGVDPAAEWGSDPLCPDAQVGTLHHDRNGAAGHLQGPRLPQCDAASLSFGKGFGFLIPDAQAEPVSAANDGVLDSRHGKQPSKSG
jgi:hypothetical protein